MIYLGSPRFVLRANGDALLIGVRPEGLSLDGDDLMQRVEHTGPDADASGIE